MTTNLLFDFTVNKEDNTINIQREFAANLALVWEAWTNPEILDQWWAPKPYRTETKSMDFREGGSWFYAMIGPEGETHWCRNDYQKIEHQEFYSGLDAFCHENGEINTEMPRTLWTNSFTENGETTIVHIVATYDSLEDIERVISFGMKEGFKMALENLDQYFASQFQLRAENKTSKQARVCSYLNFPGNTEEAFLFYQSVFKTEFVGKGLQRFGDVPPSTENWPPVADEIKRMVLHVELPILGGHILMGTDAPKEMGFTLSTGNNMHISLEPETREEADRLFNELSVGGNVTMPMADMFFGAYFGQFTDQFGINWMINFQNR